MLSSSKKVFFADYVFHVCESVYEPAEDSFLFAENLTVEKHEVVLDIGTGCGILGVIAADKASRVVAVDINPYAVRCAKENAKVNGVWEKMLFIQGDLLAPIRMEEKLDRILFNAPYLPSKPLKNGSWLERAWAGGATGRQVIDRFIRQAPEYVNETGCVLLMQSTLSDVDQTLRRFQESGFRTCIIAKRTLPFFETIVLIKAER